jgi:hypothetical protein
MYQTINPLNYVRPSLCDGKNQGSPDVSRAYPLYGAIFRAGDILALSTVGALTGPLPAGALLTVQPPQLTATAFTYSASAGAAKQVLYGYYTYAAAGPIESLPSPWFTLIVPAGEVVTVTVPTANAPAAATEFNLYLGYAPFQGAQQVASTALGSAASVPSPLTNYSGCARAATNAGTNILGMALDDYDVLYQQGPPQSVTSNQRLFGGDLTAFDPEQYQTKFAKLDDGQKFVISLIQPWTGGDYATAGLNFTSEGVFALDTTQSNKIVTIDEITDNLDNWPQSAPFMTGISGAAVIAHFNSGVLG